MEKENLEVSFALLRKRGFKKFTSIDLDESIVFSLRQPAWLWTFQKCPKNGVRINLPRQIGCYGSPVFWGVFVVKDGRLHRQHKIPHQEWRFGRVKLIAVEKNPIVAIKKWGMDIHLATDWILCWAARNGYCDIARELLACGANIHTQEDRPLRQAASTGQAEMIRLLLDAGADAFARHCSAYKIAKSHGHEEVANILHQHLSDQDNF